MGICGSCGMEINGKPVLACETNVMKSLKQKNEMEISPMTGHPLLKDLATDFNDFLSKHMSVDPYLYRKNKAEQDAAKEFYNQTKDDIEKFLPYSYCIMCGLCLMHGSCSRCAGFLPRNTHLQAHSPFRAHRSLL